MMGEGSLYRFLAAGSNAMAIWSVTAKVVYTAKLVDYVYRRYEKMLPLHGWLLEMKKRVATG